MTFDLKKARVTKIEHLEGRDAKWVKIQKVFFKDAEGRDRDWEFGSRTTRVEGSEVDGCGIIAILEKPTGKEILLQKQFRPPVNGVCIEVPAGLLDPNETIEQCAERELLEETGYVGKATKISPIMFNDPGFCNTNLKLVHVEVDMKDPRNQDPKPQLEEGEYIECFTVPLAELPQQLRRLYNEGYILDARIQNIADGIELARMYKL
ncbi:hypothetical protein TRVA0_009S02630 [Trichomonascus vanleenenianus]|uniref:ADP-ribose diphosphatase n=1 Tax=Trichomonascus vanleenenianus TaxID=2268995 RepID=UPI003ECA6DFA